jgi:hypothetical protein
MGEHGHGPALAIIVSTSLKREPISLRQRELGFDALIGGEAVKLHTSF